MDLSKLAAPFPPDRISWRVGPTNREKTKGMALAYIDARDVMARLDEVCGIGGWQNDYPHANGKTVCRIGIKIGDEWIWKSDGAGDSEMEAEKGALSDAFKRAAVRWGIGRYLYDTASPWVEIEQHGKSYSIKDSELSKLARVLQGPVPAERVEPQKPEISQPSVLAEPQATKAMNDLLDNIGGCVTADELRSYSQSAAFKGIYTTLPQKHRDRVAAAGKARREKVEASAA